MPNSPRNQVPTTASRPLPPWSPKTHLENPLSSSLQLPDPASSKNCRLDKLELSPNTASAHRQKYSQEIIRYLESIRQAEPAPRLKENCARLSALIRSNSSPLWHFEEEFKQFFAAQWQKIKDTPQDYTRLSDPFAQPFVTLARYLAKIGVVDKNYYRLLIPSLTHDDIFFIEEKLCDFPLSDFILSSNESELIYLPNCIKVYQERGYLGNPNQVTLFPLDNKEKARLKMALAPYHAFFLQALEKDKISKLSLSKTIVDLLRELVNESLNPEGLTAHRIAPRQEEKAAKAYKRFFQKIALISEKDRDILNEQCIELIYIQKTRDTFYPVRERLSFKKVVEAVEKGGCMATYGRYLAKLVLDYDPSFRFNEEIEKIPFLSSIRPYSQKKPYKEYVGLSIEEARKRVLTLCAYVLRPFPLSFLPWYLCFNRLHILDQHSYGGTLATEVLISFCRASAQEMSYPFAYAHIIENLIKPELNKRGISRWMLGEKKEQWLQAIVDGSFFTKEKTTFFAPILLLSHILAIQTLPSLKPYHSILARFIIEIIKTTIHIEALDDRKILRINVLFEKMLNKLSSSAQKELLTTLRENKTPISEGNLFNALRLFLQHNLETHLKKTGENKSLLPLFPPEKVSDITAPLCVKRGSSSPAFFAAVAEENYLQKSSRHTQPTLPTLKHFLEAEINAIEKRAFPLFPTAATLFFQELQPNIEDTWRPFYASQNA